MKNYREFRSYPTSTVWDPERGTFVDRALAHPFTELAAANDGHREQPAAEAGSPAVEPESEVQLPVAQAESPAIPEATKRGVSIPVDLPDGKRPIFSGDPDIHGVSPPARLRPAQPDGLASNLGVTVI